MDDAMLLFASCRPQGARAILPRRMISYRQCCTLAIVAMTWLAACDRDAEALPVISQLPDFQLTNQLGAPVSLASYRGQIWLADIIFTRCPGPCPVMTQTMAGLAKSLPGKPPIRLVTLTTDPKHDTPVRLREYAKLLGADTNRWDFLTGDTAVISRLATEGMKLAAVGKKPGDRENASDLFIHSTSFVLIDAHGQMRAAFNSTDPQLAAKLQSAVRQLQTQ